MHGGFGEIADQPARDYRVVRQTRRIEEAFRCCVGVVVPAGPKCGLDPTELCEGHGDIRPGPNCAKAAVIFAPVLTAIRSAAAAARSTASSSPRVPAMIASAVSAAATH